MPRRRKKVRARALKNELKTETRSAISGIVQIAAGVLMYLALQNNAGAVGNSFQEFLTFFFGRWGILFPGFLILSGLLHWFAPDRRFETKRSLGLVFCFLSFLGLMHIGAPFEEISARKEELAGVVGFMMSLPFLA